MDAELLMALHEQYLLYVEEINKDAKNLITFLEQNKDFRNGFDVAILLYIKSADLKLSVEKQECCSSPDLQVLGGDRESLRAMCSELKQLIDE